MTRPTVRVCSALFLLASAAAEPVFAGQVYGTVERNGSPAANVTVSISCKSASASRNTDAHGSYSVYVNASGNCQVRVENSTSLTIRVYPNDVRYDLRLNGDNLSKK